MVEIVHEEKKIKSTREVPKDKFTKKGSSLPISDLVELSQERELPILIKKTAEGFKEANSEEDSKKMRIVSEEQLSSFKIDVGPGFKLKRVVKVDDNTLLVGKIDNTDTDSAFCLYSLKSKTISECALLKGDSFKPSAYE